MKEKLKVLRRIDAKIVREHGTKQRYQGDEVTFNWQRMDYRKNGRIGRTHKPHGTGKICRDSAQGDKSRKAKSVVR